MGMYIRDPNVASRGYGQMPGHVGEGQSHRNREQSQEKESNEKKDGQFLWLEDGSPLKQEEKEYSWDSDHSITATNVNTKRVSTVPLAHAVPLDSLHAFSLVSCPSTKSWLLCHIFHETP